MANINIELLDYVYDANLINWNDSLLGTLDVTSHSEFPLAITFSVADIKDINARKGSFSKTFKIPATKNNNLLYKNIYLANSYSQNNVLKKKKCRIVIDNLFSINGLLQLNAVGGTDSPEYYSCVFFGNNIGWANYIDEKLLKDLGTDGDAWNTLNGKTGTNLEVNRTSIVSTFSETDASGTSAVVYPITSYGDFNPTGIEQTLQLLKTAYAAGQSGANAASVGYVGSVTNANRYNTPEPVVDWRPCLWIYDIFKEIFIQAGYKISSQFIEGDIFKRLLFCLPNFKYNNAAQRYDLFSLEGTFRKTNNAGTNTGGLIKTFSYSQTNTITKNQSFFFNVGSGETFLPTLNTSSFASGGVYTIPEFGFYNINFLRIGFIYKNPNFLNSSGVVNSSKIEIIQVNLRVIVKTVGENHWRILAQTDNNATVVMLQNDSSTYTGRYYFANNINDETRYFLNKGDIVRTQLRVKYKTTRITSADFSSAFDIDLYGSQEIDVSAPTANITNGRYDIKIQPEYVAYGQSYNLKDIINKEYKQIDFIKGVAHSFNLQFTTDEDSKTVYVEPFDTFYKPLAESLDWTHKVDLSKDYSDNWIKSSLNREIIFKYKSDSKDSKVKQRGISYFKEIEDEYPYWETLSDSFEKGTSTFENPFFAGTFNAGDRDISNNPNSQPYVSCLWEELQNGGFISPNDLSRPDKGFDFLPRLLYWKSYSPDLSSNPNAICLKYAVVQTWETDTTGIFADQNASGVISTSFPQATSANRDDSSSPLLTYGNVWVRDYDDANNSYTNYSIGKGLYDTYYKSMVSMIKENPRVRSIYINLKTKDIINLDLRTLIYIDGVYWRINKINDYSPLNNNSTKVELIKWVVYAGFVATAPVLNSSDGNWNNSTAIYTTL